MPAVVRPKSKGTADAGHSKWDVREACRAGNKQRLAELIKVGAPLDELDIDDDIGYIEGQTCWRPIQHAARNDHYECVQMLVDAGVSVNSAADDGKSALLIAAEYGSPNVIRVLLEKGADYRLCDRAGQRPLHLAASASKNMESVNELLKVIPADVVREEKDSDGWTALHHAAAVGFTDCAAKLLNEYKADAFAKDYEGWNCFGLAIANNQLQCAQIILDSLPSEAERTSIVNVLANGNVSATYIAAARGLYDALQLLIQHKANVNEVTDEGDHPLYAAQAKGHDLCVNLLQPLTDTDYLS